MATEFKIYCGSDTNGHDVDAKQLALNLAVKFFPDGHTIGEELGRWALRDHFGPTSEIVTEKTIVISWIATDQEMATGSADSLVRACASAYKTAAFQQSVLVTRQTIDADFL